MRKNARVEVVIPALNEEKSIGKVIGELPDWIDRIIVADNGSTDATAEVAQHAGADVVHEPQRGYGAACLAGIAALNNPDIVLFIDGDGSDRADMAGELIDPILQGRADMVIGSRILGQAEPGALSPQQRFGAWLACGLIRLMWGTRFTDLGPFRAIRYTDLRALEMADRDFGWTVEMQIKAAQAKLRCLEVPTPYRRRRTGRSKVSGNLRGVVGAAIKILTVLARETIRARKKQFVLSKERLILFTRWPEPGTTKTRLIPELGADGAAQLQREMTEHIADAIRRFAAQRDGVGLQISFEGGNRESMAQWLGGMFRFRRQAHGDLGDRMHEAFARAFLDGAHRVVIIGSDCPSIDPEILNQAFEALVDKDLAIGPAEDGGYYLIGMSSMNSEIFDGIPWGTHRVLERTLDTAQRLQLQTESLKILTDIDRPEDLDVWNAVRDSSS